MMSIKEMQDSDVERLKSGIEYIFEIYEDFVGVFYILEKDGRDILLHQVDNVFTVVDIINEEELETFSFYIDDNYDLAGVEYDQFEYHIKDGEHLFIEKETHNSASISLISRPNGEDVDGYNGLVRYTQYNNKTKDRLTMSFQHMMNYRNQIYRFHTNNPFQVIMYRKFVPDKKGNFKYKSRQSYISAKYDIRDDEISYNLATIVDYGLKEFLEKGAYALQKNERTILKYYKILFTTPSEYAVTGFPFCNQYDATQMKEFIESNGFNYEIPAVYLDIYNRQDAICNEALSVIEVYKAMMKNNEEVLKLSKGGEK